KYHQENPNQPGIIRGSIWGRFGLLNKTDDKLILVIENAHTADLYYIQKGDTFSKASSIYEPFHSRDLLSNKLSFLLDIPKDSTVNYHIKFQTNSGTESPLSVYNLNAWIEKEHQILILDGIYLGIMIIMILYNLFIYFAIRDKSYLLYVLYVAFMTLTNMNIKSISFEFLWPNHPELNHYVNIAPCLAGIFSILFANSFLHLYQYSRRLRRIFLGIITAYIITIIINLLEYQFLSFLLTEIISLVAVITLWIAGYIIYKKGYRPALFFLIAWSAMLVFVIIFVLKDYNILPFNDFTANSITIGSALEAVLLSLALANRIRIYKKEREVAQKQAMASLKENQKLVLEQNILLENKVEERTIRLKSANEELTKTVYDLKQTQAQLIKVEKEKMEATYHKELFELEAKALRAQMNPHFIFNCMNSIKALIQNDEKQKSIDYLITFSKLIRTLFNNADKRQVNLYDELETCKLYTELEAMRLEGKLQYHFEIDETIDLKSVMVPALIIQPFIENAIWHGIVPKETGMVSVRIQGNDDTIFCEIEDDGIGREIAMKNKPLSPGTHQSKGINLSQARLHYENILSENYASVKIIDKYTGNIPAGT
ncbi:MAG TPA: 7TM diverse intracellular signaling domain-containing protein, partial [Chitinophagaceae bacterium]